MIMSFNVGKSRYPHITVKDGIPKKPHYAIITYELVSVSNGWDNYGSSEIVARYHVLPTEEEWLAAVADLQRQKIERKYGAEIDFVAFHVDKFALPEVKINITAEIK